MTYYLSLYLSVCLSTFVCRGRASSEIVCRANARARHKGRGSERARKRDLNPLRLSTGYKYRSRMGTRIARGVVRTFLFKK